MNAPCDPLPLTVRSGKPLAPSLEQQRLRLSAFLMIADAMTIFASFLLVAWLYHGEFPSEMALRGRR